MNKIYAYSVGDNESSVIYIITYTNIWHTAHVSNFTTAVDYTKFIKKHTSVINCRGVAVELNFWQA